MDLQVASIILVVFLVSFLSYLFISKFLPHGKTFDEMIAEKKRLREEMLASFKPSAAKQSSSSSSGGKKKSKKEVKKKDSPPKKTSQSQSDSEEGEDEEALEQEILREAQRAAANKRKPKPKKEVSPPQKVSISESAEEPEEVIAPPKPVIVLQTAPDTIKINKPQQTNNKKKGKSGILVNKNEPVLVKDNSITEEENHFEEIHPKDAVEIQRSSATSDEKNTRNFRDNKKNKKEPSPVSPKNQKKVEEVVVKKKRSVENSAVQSHHSIADETEITHIIRELSRSDLTKNQIQVLIDFLLNKQSDTIAMDPTEWTEGKSDLVQKLKKQLQEKEAQLKNEQDALSGMQMKLKDLRAEFNNEKIQFNASLKMHMEQLHGGRAEIKGLQSEIQFLNEKHNSEKQALSMSFKQLQQKYMQVSESLKAFENLPNIQQIQSENQMLQNEIIAKNQQIVELKGRADESRQMEDAYKQKLAEFDSKNVEMEVRLRKKDENCMLLENEMRQRVQDLSSRDNEIQKLNTELAHAKEILQRQTIEKEQINQQLSSLQSNHAEENKIEFKNLQNALDSSKKELEAQRMIANDYKLKAEDLSKQVAENKQLTQKSGDSFLLNEKMNEMTMNHQNVISEKDKQLAEYQKQIDSLQKSEGELFKQIEEQKVKNNDLRTKNWKLVEALQTAQSSSSSSSTTTKITSNHSVAHSNGIDVKTVKDLLVEYFPEQTSASAAASEDETKWLKSVLENLKTCIVSNNKSNHNNNSTSTSSSPINANHKTINSNSNNNCHDNTHNGDTNSTTSASMDNELILLQNAQLRTSVEEYKNIIAETESMLKNLESKVREQDAYWTKVVLMKDNEITNLKNPVEQS